MSEEDRWRERGRIKQGRLAVDQLGTGQHHTSGYAARADGRAVDSSSAVRVADGREPATNEPSLHCENGDGFVLHAWARSRCAGTSAWGEF